MQYKSIDAEIVKGAEGERRGCQKGGRAEEGKGGGREGKARGGGRAPQTEEIYSFRDGGVALELRLLHVAHQDVGAARV